MTFLHAFITTHLSNRLLYVPVCCRSTVVEVLQILSKIRCNDSIMAIAEKYHYEDVIYSHQLLNQETVWTANSKHSTHCHFESNSQRLYTARERLSHEGNYVFNSHCDSDQHFDQNTKWKQWIHKVVREYMKRENNSLSCSF